MTTNTRRPPPLYLPKLRKRCPVCGEISYSAAGIHPQCAVRQADPNCTRTRIQRKPERSTPEVNQLPPWQKPCPGCGATNHVRLKVCSCGHQLLKSGS